MGESTVVMTGAWQQDTRLRASVSPLSPSLPIGRLQRGAASIVNLPTGTGNLVLSTLEDDTQLELCVWRLRTVGQLPIALSRCFALYF